MNESQLPVSFTEKLKKMLLLIQDSHFFILYSFVGARRSWTGGNWQWYSQL